MIEKLAFIWPEIALFLTTCVVMVVGLSPRTEVRRSTPWVAALGLVIAGVLAANSPTGPGLFPEMMPYIKGLVAIVGLMMLMLAAGTVDRESERLISAGKAVFDPLRATKAEFYAFFLFSLTGLMLCASADDLIWLFLALELTSLPTYMMVTISTRGTRSQEAGVKYFFLGALGAAVFLYGFALLYGATGSTRLLDIAAVFQEDGISTLGLAGLMLSILGIAFKIAAVPMHFYTPDVYQGSSSTVSAFLAFVPKTAGFVALMMIVGTAGWVWGEAGTSLPEPVYALLWAMAVLTMTVGNVMALLQRSVKRILAYSSIAHSGYMLVGLIVGPGVGFISNGLAAVLFYLLAYGVMNVGAFAVLACLEREDGEEPDDIESLRGLCVSHPHLGWTMVLCSLSLLGMPPLLGFIAKLGLFTSGISAGEIPLVIILGVNSAIAAFYYLRLVTVPYLDRRDEDGGEVLRPSPVASRPVAAVVSAGSVVFLLLVAQVLVSASERSATYVGPDAADREAETYGAARGPSDETGRAD